MIEVHATAVVHSSARLGDGVRIGPYVVVGEHVTLGEGTILGPHAVIEAFTTMGRDCQVFPGAVVGGIPQDLKFAGEESYLLMGDRNVVRECATINRATGMGDETRIGDDNLFMAYVHIAHNCIVGSHIVMSNGVTLAGHVVVEDHAIIGGLTGLHQFIRVGAHCMIGAMSRVAQDVPPYLLIEGNPPKVYGPNVIGLRRRGMALATRSAIKQVFKLVYRGGLNIKQAIAAVDDATLAIPEIAHFVAFLLASQRGVIGLGTKAAPVQDDED